MGAPPPSSTGESLGTLDPLGRKSSSISGTLDSDKLGNQIEPNQNPVKTAVQMGGMFPKTKINPDNFTLLYRNLRLMNNISELLSYIYAACSQFEDSLMKSAIEELLNYMIDSKDTKHIEFLKLIANNNNFKIADTDSELSSKINQIFLFAEQHKKGLTEVDLEFKKALNQESLDKCDKSKKKIMDIVKNGGSFTKRDALLLEFCNNAIDKFLES